jgi:hypothetical protein
MSSICAMAPFSAKTRLAASRMRSRLRRASARSGFSVGMAAMANVLVMYG